MRRSEPLFLTRYIEKAGTGILDMIKLCKAAGVPTPQFRQEGGQFIQTLRRPQEAVMAQVTAQVAGEVTGEVTGEVATGWAPPTQSSDPVKRLLIILQEGDRSAGELRQAARIKHRHTFRTNYLHPALKQGLISNTIPEKPASRLQKYRLTEKGRAWLSGRKA